MSSSELAVCERCKLNYNVAVCEPTVCTKRAVEGNGVTDYPVINFDEQALADLTVKVQESLKGSKIKPGGGAFYRFVKRTVDIVASALLITISAIPVGIIAGMIYLEDKGNPIFVQKRLTKDGKVFNMYKLRSMCVDAEAKFKDVQKINKTGGIAFKNENDPRVTKIGKFIRKTSIDELPQLFNVLKGDMSFIGPRPPLPREVYLYDDYTMQRLMVKGGLACYCQCSGRSNMSFEQWMDTDIKYIQERSLWVDVKMCLKTVKAIFTKNGAH